MKPARDPQYLAWIRTLPCIVCQRTGGIEAAHTGPRGIGQKSPDRSVIPLCAGHHRTRPDSYHRLGARRFSEKHGIDIPGVVRRLNAKPTVLIRDAQYLALIEGEVYFLGRASDGLLPALRTLRKLWWQCRLEMPAASNYGRRFA